MFPEGPAVNVSILCLVGGCSQTDVWTLNEKIFMIDSAYMHVIMNMIVSLQSLL